MKPLIDYCLINFTNSIEPWKVIHHTALKLIEARRAGTAKPAKVRYYGMVAIPLILFLL